MPRRRALTEAQLEILLALPAGEADLIRHWTLDAADLAVIERRRGGHHQLGYAPVLQDRAQSPTGTRHSVVLGLYEPC